VSRAGRARLDSYTFAGLGVFLMTVAFGWKAHVISHEMIYLLGSRRVADPSFLAHDFTWAKAAPTTFLYDHLIAPLWSFLSEFAIVNVGRFVVWALTAWSLARFARTLRLPAWSLVAGFALWLAWKQTIADCGAPFEGLQVKSFAYPLVFFALDAVMRGRVALGGALAGLGTAFHVVVGGWGFLGIAIAMLFAKERRALRQIAAYLLCAAPFVIAIVGATAVFVESGVTPDEHETIDATYVTIAAPACCQLDEFMTPHRWLRTAVVFALAALTIFAWRERVAARILGGFVAALGLFMLAAEIAQRLDLYWALKLLPCQLGLSLPALFLFVLFFAWTGRPRGFADLWFSGRRGARARRLLVVAAVGAAVAGVVWLALDRGVPQNLAAIPRDFARELGRPQWGGGPPGEPDNGTPALYAWIRENTPRDSVFVTPLLKDFWPYGQRAQVASRRHWPFDRRLIEWVERLEALNELDLEGDLTAGEENLTAAQLTALRDRYGATHYLVRGERPDLAALRLATIDGFSIYALAGIEGAAAPSAAR